MDNKVISLPNKPSNKINIKVILIIVGLVIIASLIIFLIIYNNNSNKLKRYLTKQGYDCTNTLCLQITDDGIKTFNYQNGNYKYETKDYSFSITKSSYEYRENKTINCSYINNGKEISDDINNIQQCNKNIEKMNNEIKYYNKIISDSNFKRND